MSSEGISLDVMGLDGIGRMLGILADAVDADAVRRINTGVVRPTQGPPGFPTIMRKRWSLEEQVKEAFKQEGKTVQMAGWANYLKEPKYAAFKAAQGGGTQVGIWEGSANPLFRTFLLGDPDHRELITEEGFEWGSARYYAWRFHEGGYQRWDKVDADGRPIVVISDRMMFEVSRATQRYVMGTLRAAGLPPSTVRFNL